MDDNTERQTHSELNDMTYWEIQEAWKAGQFNDRGEE